MCKHRRIVGVLLCTAVVGVVVTSTALAQQKEGKKATYRLERSAPAGPDAPADKLKPQTVCPVRGGKINKDVFVDVAGYRIYACCPPCLSKIKADPAKAVAALRAKGEKPELRLVVCSGCGEIKGGDKCCRVDAQKCLKCGLNKGSIGCCQGLKPAAGLKGVAICPGCGEVKGGDKCCQADAQKCPKCGLNKGAPGCCQDLKAGGKDIVICPGCGEVKGGDKCCRADAQKCPKCGLNKGAPGCCKIGDFVKNKD